MHLLGHVCTGPTNHHNGGWRHPDSDADQLLDARRYEELARIYERGLFDGVFIVDYQIVQDLTSDAPSMIAQRGGQMAMLEPLLVLAVMARASRHLGLAATMSTTLNHAYHIARCFATLDHLSGGRAGWNIVTSSFDQEAKSFGQDRLPDREARYDQADETVEACLQLWNSWDADALKVDRASGLFADPAKLHYQRYNGARVRTEGALTTPRSPQGHPVLMQAGASGRGLNFAARWAECIFVHQQEKRLMQTFYAGFKDRVAAAGRDPNMCAVMPSIEVMVGESDAEAQDYAGYLDSFATPEMGLGMIGRLLRRDLSDVPLDTPLADLAPDGAGAISVGATENMFAIQKDERGLTLGEAAMLQATTWWSPRLVGSAKTVVDQLEDIFTSGCCEGFVITQALSPNGLSRFVDLVVPELQRRSLYRTEYRGRTFRDNLRDDWS